MKELISSKEYDYFEREKCIRDMCNKWEFIQPFVIGKSCEGRNIKALKIGSSESYCLIAAGIHGSERITSTVLLMFLEELCQAVESDGYLAGIMANKALRGRGLILVPCVNPDGCDISLLGEKACGDRAAEIRKQCNGDFSRWNANARGVDINHNFDAGWKDLRKLEQQLGIYGPSPTRFGGYHPNSEPETVALIELCAKYKIRHCVALHSQGEVIYWDYGDKTPAKSRRMAEIAATSSGYALDVPISIATGGGFKDWFIEKYSRPGFTVEIGKGKNPLDAQTAREIYEQIKEMLILFAIM